ncbi:hypothetical protein HYN59_14000 [Flavobacterium album]|uniref:Uncharacterized protein n=1 Tax=Flavobacterium album TaxID=2175091 RepID=A0A2S1R0E6_9FLAO|nr:hypothetical protein [Flavobacterium album]AWH86153.1 hypothetical protein HYN59_14000 [Flavobacterium album]
MKNLSLLCLAALSFIACKKETEVKAPAAVEKPATETPLIAQASPRSFFNTDNLSLQEFTIEASGKATVKGKNGTKLDIPANAFVDADGKPVKGKVTVQLKEALNMADIVLGGLATMSGDKILESGGMVYVNATSGGKPLFLADSKKIEITMPAKKKVPGMQIFSGEESKDGTINWVDPKNIIAPNEVMVARQKELIVNDDQLDNNNYDILAPIAPLKPVEYKKSDGVTINLVFPHPEYFPEFSYFKNVKWKLTDPQNYKKPVDGTQWEHVALAKAKTEGTYTLTLTAEGKPTLSYEVIPVFEGQDFKKAMAEYEKAIERIEKQKKEMEEKERIRRKKQELEKQKISIAESYIFSIDKMGWANCDKFYNDPKAKDVIVEINISDKQKSDVAISYLVFKKRKVCIPCYMDKKCIAVMGNIHLPIGEPVTIIAVGAYKETPWFAMEDAVVSDKLSVTLKPDEISKESMKQLLDKNLHQ